MVTDYHRPETLDTALGILADTRAAIAAGCTDLYPATQAQTLRGQVLDVTRIASLRGIANTEKCIRIGATTKWSDIIDADLPPAFDMLKEAAKEVGSVQIQNSGTVAGNLCNASPAADGVPCLLALDANVEIASIRGYRDVPLNEFITGPRKTVLEPDELVTAIDIPNEAAGGISRFLKLGARRHLVISIAMVAVRLVVEDQRIADAAVSVGSCSAVAKRLSDLEAELTGRDVSNVATGIDFNALISPNLAPIADIRADALYRNTSACELVRRAIDDLTVTEAGAAA